MGMNGKGGDRLDGAVRLRKSISGYFLTVSADFVSTSREFEGNPRDLQYRVSVFLKVVTQTEMRAVDFVNVNLSQSRYFLLL